MNVVLIFVVVGFVAVTEQSVVSTAQGLLRGEVHDGYVSYRGVPYASEAAPEGRFKRAGLAPLWQGTRESREVHCSPVSSVNECLQLDVHVPAAGGLRPVLLWVAGAGNYNPRSLVLKGIIVIVVYHRVGPLGFLCLVEDKIPGNAGVKDVVLALRWVRDNIVAFKGNSERVVMAGQGFGAAIVEAVMLSPMSAGLYHGVILQSGSVLAPWAFNYDAKRRAMKLEEMLHESGDSSAIFLEANVEDLVDKSNKMDISYFPFGICIETGMKHEERLLSEAPFALLSSRTVGGVPMMVGYNSDEAYIFGSILQDSSLMEMMARQMTFLLPEELKFLNEREMRQVARQVEEMYFKSNITWRAILDYHRDAYFVNHIHRSTRLHAAAHHPVYFYQFSYSGDVGVQEEPRLQKAGAAHSDELAYLFSGRDLNGEEGSVQMHFLKLWTNFVIYLDPTHEEPLQWEAFDAGRARLLLIGPELKMADYPHVKASSLWDDVYEKYYYERNRVGG